MANPDASQRSLLWAVLAINFALFALESSVGLLIGSMGLVADSLDMLADAIVYGLSLLAVGRASARKRSVAVVAGYLQATLALIGFAEVVRRFLSLTVVPDFRLMVGVSLLALVGNSLCLYLLHRAQSSEAHMRASVIFTNNDVIINVGVIVAGLLVALTGSSVPDLVIGAVVFIIVLRGAARILRLGKSG